MLNTGSPITANADDEPAAPDPLAAPRALRRYFATHNRQAVVLAVFALGASAVLWSIIYVLIYWFCLVGVTLERSFNPATLVEITDPAIVGTQFPFWFLGGALLTLAAAACMRRKLKTEKLREHRHYVLWVLAELLMAVPNVTFSIWGNLSAVTRLRRRDALHAWRLLERIHREGGKLDITNLRQEIEDERTLQKVVFSLQLVGLVSLRENTTGWFLYLQNREAFSLLSRAATGQ